MTTDAAISTGSNTPWGTIGKALILTDYSIDEEKDIDKLKAFRESQKGMG